MQIQKVADKKALSKFLKFADALYRGDKFYVPYMKADLKKVLTKLVLQDKTYTALIAVRDGKTVARLLYTVDRHKQFKELGECGFFSLFECEDCQTTADTILSEMCGDLRRRGIKRVEGTYFPFDQDNRRGILVEGFDSAPVLLTSYNKDYYPRLLQNFGMTKDFDTLAYAMTPDTLPIEKFRRVSSLTEKRYGYYVETADFDDIDKLIGEVGAVMKAATTEDIFQDAPSIEALRNIVRQWKKFLKEELCLLARSAADGKLVGVVIAVPDFNQVFRRMKGRLNPVALAKMLYYKNKITTVRGLLQYVIPEWQNKGVILSLYAKLFDACDKMGVNLIEASTMMENNTKPNETIKSAGGVLYKRYRLYGMRLDGEGL